MRLTFSVSSNRAAGDALVLAWMERQQRSIAVSSEKWIHIIGDDSKLVEKESY
jgi:hypothetical protein